MPWQKSSVSAPISDAIIDVADGVDTVLSILDPILTIAETALEVAKVFVKTTTDPAATLFDAVIAELENLINDLFATGVYCLEVNPFNIQASSVIVPGAVGGPSPIIGRWDDFGIPLMTPNECIIHMINSFDDLGDAERPQFSNEASTVAFGFLITAPDISGFLALIDAFMAVFEWPGFDLMRKRMTKQITEVVPSVYPDWISLRLNSIKQLKDVQDSLLELINTLKGYRNVLNNIFDLIDMIETKIKTLEDIVKKFRDRLQTLKNAAKASGIYVFNYPLQTGGNKAVQAALADPYLQSICTLNNGYTASLLLLGGGPSAAPISAIKDLVL
jgi:hypothetical protein